MAQNKGAVKDEDVHVYGGYRPQSNLSGSVQHYDQQRGQQSRQGPSFGSDDRAQVIGQGLRPSSGDEREATGTLGPRDSQSTNNNNNQAPGDMQRIESKESANWGDSMDQK